MKIVFLCLCLFPSALTVPGAELQSFTIHDAGQKREFALAVDELSLRGPGGTRRVEQSAAGTTAELLAAAGRRSAATGEPAELIYYETGRARSEQSRRVLSKKVLVRLAAGTSAAAVAGLAGAIAWTQPEYFQEGAVLTFQGTAGAAVEGAAKAAAVPGVLSAEPLMGRRLWARHIPNDPYFAWNAANAGYQWHLRNTGQDGALSGSDANLTTAWDTWKGQGIRIGIIDDGLQVTHPDLSPNVDTAIDYDWNGADNDPSPGTGDDHGTACAGVAAARGDNNIGVTGAAPLATLVGLRLISGLPTDAEEAASMAHRNDVIQIKSNSWGPYDGGTIVEGPGALTAAAFANAAATGRAGLGTIFLWAAGNGLPGDDSNFDGYANSIYVIAVAATGDQGTQADYSEPGANILIAAPSSGNGQRISTADITGSSGYNSGGGTDYTDGNYTNSFGGTSSACPLAAGCTALLLQSKPALGWRDVKEILIRSATKTHPADQGWFTNAAGFQFNDKYGAGLVNASAAVTLAATWTNLGPMVNRIVSLSTPGAAIPDNSTTGVVRTFVSAAAENMRAEQVTLHVDVAHSRRGDLEIFITSPSGTISHLIRPRPFDTGSGLVWTMSTPQFWGENSAGTWRVHVMDRAAGSTGTLNAATLTIFGTTAPLIPNPALADAIDTSASVFSGGTAGWTRQTTDTHDGFDAAQSGAIGHSQESRMDTTVTGPAAISFWWRVSCDAGDRLACLVDGVEVASLTGSAAWQQHQRTVGAGTHSIVWRYVKDATVSAGSDAGWVDQITSGPITDPPAITSPLTATGTNGQAVSYQITASNEPSSFNASGLPAGLAVDTVTGVISGIPSVTGVFNVTLSATNGAGSGSAILVMSISDYSGGIAAALDVTGLQFTAPDVPWLVETATTHDGQDAARSAVVPHDGSSTLHTVITGPVVLSFWWKVSSEEGYDYLRLLLDGTEIASISGEQEWVQVTRGIKRGAHVVEWRYTKDNIVTEGSDAGWVDQVELIPITQPPVIDSPLAVTALIGMPFSYQISATNVPASFNASGLPEGLIVNTSTGLITGSPTSVAGTSSSTISATNGFGTGTATLIFTVADYSGTMNAALDTTGLSFTSSGAALWFNQSATTHDGTDAVQSGLIGDSASSTLTTTVTGPVILSFWWKVSCESDYDELRLYIDGVQNSSITGEQEWTEVVRGVGSGSHTVEWSYVKDSIVTDGSDAGWVDGVQLTPVTQPPVISGPFAVTALAGTPFTYQIMASNVPSSYDASGLPAGLTVNSATGLISGTPAAAGIYPCTLSATNAIGTGTATLTITIGNFSNIMNAALDSTALNYTGTGEAVWFSQAVTTHDGTDAAQSGVIDDSSSSSLGLTLTGPVDLSFWWRVSSEATYDDLTLTIDDVTVVEITGEQPWARVTQLIPPGSHTVRWTYSKDGSFADGADAGWIDQVTITPATLNFVPLTATGAITGFQEPPLGAANYVRGTNGAVELGWTAGVGFVSQTGNRYPALTGAFAGGTPGVKSFVINNNAGPVTLRTDAVRLDGFINVRGSADVRTYTTSATGFESQDNLRVMMQVSGDGFLWTPGPDIMPPRTGGSPDNLLPLTASGNAIYFNFTSPVNAVPLTARYARIVVTGQNDSASEFLVVDNLRLTGTPAPDADGDGFNAFDEAWFGTSDSAAAASPLPLLSLTGGTTVRFPGVAGRSYAIDTSSDLITWEATLVTASGSLVSWTDPLAATSPHRYYRVRRP